MKNYSYNRTEDGEPYCPSCDKIYQSDRGYRYHINRKHNGVEPVDDDVEDFESNPGDILTEITSDNELSQDEKFKEIEKAVRNFNNKLTEASIDKSEANFNATSDYIILLGISDLHYGNKNVNMDYVDELLEFVADNDNVFCFLSGDLIDNWVKLAPSGGIYEQTLPPEYQREVMNRKLAPIKDKILAIVSGNHEQRSERQGDENPSKMMAKELDCTYLGFGGRINIKFNDGPEYKVHVRHKYKFNSTYNPTHTCVKLIQNKDTEADVVCVGHHHEPAIASHYVSGKQRSLLRFGSSMASTGFSESIGFAKTPLEAPSVLLKGDRKVHHPFLDLELAKTYTNNS